MGGRSKVCDTQGVSASEGGTVYDFVAQGEELHRSVLDVCAQLEAEGWVVVKRASRGLRYWCPCPRRHGLWIDTEPVKEERLEFLLRKTCLTFK